MGKKIICILTALILTVLSGCGKAAEDVNTTSVPPVSTTAVTETTEEKATEKDEVPITVIKPGETLKMLEKDFYVSSYSGDYGFDELLERGGVKSDSELTDFLIEYVVTGQLDLMLQYMGSGCSTLAASDKNGNEYFGRNYDWNYCEGIIMLSEPKNGYRSVSTVDGNYVTNPNFEIEGDIKRLCALYCPLDGMNEKGVCICVNMISDNNAVDQNTEKPDITTTTAIRLVLDKAAS
ncbi:MAG: linear amide C-N hydrolase, partial [Clostridia bacterium]|nr:linear amide C-N hydrolase [Clostridia bacterium]